MMKTRSAEAGPGRRDVLRAAVVAGVGTLLNACRAATQPPAVHPGPRPPGEPASGTRRQRHLEVRGSQLYRDGKPFYVSGFNYWAALPILMQSGSQSDRGWARIRRDLDALQGAGVNLLRVIAATEGPDTEPLRIIPTLQPEAGRFDARGTELLCALVEELDQRQLPAIMVLNNFWPWSGGMAQYVSWAGGGPIPYPPPHPGGSWRSFQKYAARFYSEQQARQRFTSLIQYLVPKLAHSRSVIWELANEPRGIGNVDAFHDWLESSARLIKSLAPDQLVTTGCEGETPSPFFAGLSTIDDHRSPDIDFVTVHMWAQNWGWVQPDRLAETLPEAIERARRYITEHGQAGTTLGKPVLLEEFGFPRDAGSCSPDAPVTMRDRYFGATCDAIEAAMASSPICGLMPWAWAGDTRPPRPGELWSPGDPFTGDPPHEPQGWYSVYTSDESTLKIVRDWSTRMSTRTANAHRGAG